jgi:hypothetical protein
VKDEGGQVTPRHADAGGVVNQGCGQLQTVDAAVMQRWGNAESRKWQRTGTRSTHDGQGHTIYYYCSVRHGAGSPQAHTKH